MSLQHTEAECASVSSAPRVSLADIEEAIAYRYHVTADSALSNEPVRIEDIGPLSILSICFVMMKNGFTVIGKSAPVSPANFNAELGKKLAYEDAVRQIWPLMGFALRDKLHHERAAA